MSDLQSLWFLVTGGLFLFMFCLEFSMKYRSKGGTQSREAVTEGQLSLTPEVEKEFEELPSPYRLPFVGHLHHLTKDNPFVVMTKLGEVYGTMYHLQLGSVPAVVVSSLEIIKEVLIKKSEQFGDRASFRRYHTIFGGDKENSLAFCNWSTTQQTRRALARQFCHNKVHVDNMLSCAETGCAWLTDVISKNLRDGTAQTKLKANIHQACANIFFQYLTSQTFDPEDEEFITVVRYFDDIFWDINQSHPTDVLPFFNLFYTRYFSKMSRMSMYIRKFVLKRVIPFHRENLDENPRDLVDSLLMHLDEDSQEDKSKLTMDQILFELEDLIGGHAAVANLITRALVEITTVAGLTEKIFEECVVNDNISYMQAVLYETLRVTSSPIVPHIASADTSINGYKIKKGTMVIFNNYELNLSNTYWSRPKQFIPERFLLPSGEFRKPSHFLPFSTGKRACMGFKLVEKAFHGIFKTIISAFDVKSENPNELPQSCVALHPDIHLNVNFLPRDT